MHDKIDSFHDGASGLAKIIWCPMGVMFLCPFVLLTYAPLADYFWDSHPPDDINDALAIFLTPSGLVYALLFASAYDAAKGKWNETAQLLRQEMSHMQHILIICVIFERSCDDEGILSQATNKEWHDSDAPDVSSGKEDDRIAHTLHMKRTLGFVANVCKVINGMCLRTVMEIRGEGAEFRGPNEWDIIPLISTLTRRADGSRHRISGETEQLYAMLMDLVRGYDAVRSSRDHATSKGVHPLQWMVLEVLSLAMFYGILMTQGGSAKFEFAICDFAGALECRYRFFIGNLYSMELLYGRAWRLTARFGGVPPGGQAS